MLFARLPSRRQPSGERSGSGARKRSGARGSSGNHATGPYLVGLPGNPLAALSGLVTLAAPLIRTLADHPAERTSSRH